MESSYLQERRIIAISFNPIRDSVFLLSNTNDRLNLTEEDLAKNILLQRYKLLKPAQCFIQNTNYRILPKDTFEGYGLYFWELKNKLIVFYPFGYVLIYDYQTAQLTHHFQCHGRKAYVIRNIIGSPLQENLFISAEGMRNVYMFNYSTLESGIVYHKLVLPQNESVYDVVCHPNEKFVFIACTDSIVHIFDYSDPAKIREVKNGIVDYPLSPDGKALKNQAELIKKSNLHSVITIDINSTGNYLLSGNENGVVYLWDAFMAMKDKRILITKQRVSVSGVFSLKFLTTKQFINLERFICLTKEGKFFIYSIMSKEATTGSSSSPSLSTTLPKTYIFDLLYENSTFNPIIYPLMKYNLIPSNLIKISYFANVLSIMWPNLKLEKIKMGDKVENYLLISNFSAKFFFLYDNYFPKVNFALSTQLKFRSYEEYIPSKKMLVFESRVFMVDNFFIYVYEVMTGRYKKMLNYAKEFNLKVVYPLKFEVKEEGADLFLLILIENENNKKSGLLLDYNPTATVVKYKEKIDDIIDFVILGRDTEKSDFVYMISRDKQNGLLYSLTEKKKLMKAIEASVVRVYRTPFKDGFCVLYRNVLNELKFSANLLEDNQFAFRCINDNGFKLDFSEREIDVLFTKYDERIFCAISMIEKIVITDETMRQLYTFKLELNSNPNIISSMFWLGKTLIYTKGTAISYYYGDDNINQKIFTNNLPSTFIAGVLPDRFILVSKGRKEIDSIVLTTPAINPLEPILIGYLDNPRMDYNLIKECVINLFTNQISQALANKFIKLDLKEVAWMFLSDSKSSFQQVDKKVSILNDLLKFDMVMENIITNKDMKNEMHLDELIWRLHYDQSYEHVKVILQKEAQALTQYGQFNKAVKILELLGDYPRALELLLIATTKEEYEKLRVMFQAKGCLSFSDNLLVNNAFCLQYKPDDNNPYSMNHYSKIFDNYTNEHFIFGANQDKYSIESIQGIENKLNRRNSYITNISKKTLSFGETPFSIYVNAVSKETGKEGPSAICNVVLQRIEQFYGYKNTIYEETGVRPVKKADFQDFSVPLTQIQSQTQENKHSDVLQGKIEEDVDDNDNDDINVGNEEINECLYLSAYYHCDKGSGIIVEDITDNSNDAYLSYVNTTLNSQQSQVAQSQQPQSQMEAEENALWSSVIDEFEPLEYEDKWGRKSPGAHSIKFSKKAQTKLKVKYTPSLFHLTSRFTIELWVKLNSFNVTLLTKDTLSIEIQNGQFKLSLQNNLLQGDKVLDYSLPLNTFFHITIIYRKKKKLMKILLNCEEAITFVIALDSLSLTSDLVIGNGNLDAEVTEVKIWNNEMPTSFLKENYRSPLPILAENKRKLRMKINRQDETANQPKKKFDFNRNAFQFGNDNKQESSQANIGASTKEMYDFNPNANDNEVSISYPNLSSVLEDSVIAKGGQPGNDYNNNLQFGFKFDEVNNQNTDINMGENNNGNPEAFNFQINDFNFDK